MGSHPGSLAQEEGHASVDVHRPQGSDDRRYFAIGNQDAVDQAHGQSDDDSQKEQQSRAHLWIRLIDHTAGHSREGDDGTHRKVDSP
ncbi:hypothetical protein SDC9_65833 [bioreactor metagenome]|uniref:Uncharacterized protein n=1 Tax=bioreactor metagenome TaxID=1076179 RepID=A0A644XT72_9ZZZZ